MNSHFLMKLFLISTTIPFIVGGGGSDDDDGFEFVGGEGDDMKFENIEWVKMGKFKFFQHIGT